MDAKMRKRLRRKKKKGMIDTKHNQGAKTSKGKQSDFIHHTNELENNLPRNHAATNSDRALKSLTLALNSNKRKDSLSFISEIQENPSAISKQSLNKALLSACNKGNTFLVQTLLVYNAEVNSRDYKQNTPLMLCAMNGFCDIARILIQRGADVNCVNVHGDSALILSVTNSGSTDMVQLLLDQKVDITIKNNESHTCLSRAVEFLHFNIIEILLQKTLSKYCYNGHDRKQMIAHAQTVAQSLRIHKIFNYLEKEINENITAIVIAASQSDLESVNFILNFIASKKSKPTNFYEGVIMQVMTCYENRNADVNSNDIEIVRKLIEREELRLPYYYRDENILGTAVSIGNNNLLELLCGYLINSSKIDPISLRQIFHIGFKQTCQKCSCECLKILLKYKPDLVSKQDYSAELLGKALQTDAVDFVEVFLRQNTNIDVMKALEIIIENDQIKCFGILLDILPQKVASVICNKSLSILHNAAKVGNPEIILKLLELGADVNGIYKDKTPLMYCRKPEAANILLQHGADINFKVKHSQFTVLLNLFSDYRTDMSKMYISHFYKVNISDSNMENTKQLVNLYIKHGADVEAKDSQGQTALMLASKLECFNTVLEILLMSGADPNKSNKEDKTALHFAVSENCRKNVETLINVSADVNKKCHLGKTCLHFSIENQDLETLKLLLEHGADINMEDNLGNTPFLLTTDIGRIRIDLVNYLLDVGSNVNYQNKKGYTALMNAAKLRSLELMKLLYEKGADINVRNIKDSKNVVDILLEEFTSGYLQGDLLECTKYVLEKNVSAANVETNILFLLISQDQSYLIQKLIFSGLSPSECPVNRCRIYVRDLLKIPTISPFVFALINNKLEFAEYFNTVSFLTALDIFDRERVKYIRLHLISKKYIKCLEFLDEFYSQPLSLEKLCLISVSSALGPGIERGNKVNKLPLPACFKERLMYKTEGVLHESHFDNGKEVVDNVDFLSLVFDDDYDSVYYGYSDDSYDYDSYDYDS